MIIDHYLRREISVPFLAVSGVLVSIFVTYRADALPDGRQRGLLAPRSFPADILKSLISLEVLLPLSLYLAV